jgi:putative ABC transport system permease protein
LSLSPADVRLPQKLRDALLVALEAQGRYKLRTSLSVLGVVLGVAAVIAMMSVTEGARRDALEQVQLLGLDNLVARNRVLTLSEARGGTSPGLTVSDALLLPELVPWSASVSPLVERTAVVSQAGRMVVVPLVGIRPSYQHILNLRTGRGRLLAFTDEQSGDFVTVLGAQLARKLFGYADPVDQVVRLEKQYYRVVGVLADQAGRSPTVGALAWRDLNNAALAPLATVSRKGMDVMPAQRVDEIWLQAADGDSVEPTSQVLRRALKSLHRGQEDFDIVIPRELLQQRYRTQRTFSVVVGSVAALALIIGGIGIMNIMLTSVVERTHEIGIRRTVGATRRDIATQFLVEALLMTVGGGLFGIAVGAVVSLGITAYADWPTRVSPLAIALAFGVSISVGLVFGIYPATKAAQLEPIDAVRYE